MLQNTIWVLFIYIVAEPSAFNPRASYSCSSGKVGCTSTGAGQKSPNPNLAQQEERFGTYDTGSATEVSTNVFQRVKNQQVIGTGPVWVRNTRQPRAHVEALLKKCTRDARGSNSLRTSSPPRST